ncbi:MAG: hypothetical protein JXB08_01170 [Bacilli bacterium]|nr:hypothetical protein [Bacilli bacterium]
MNRKQYITFMAVYLTISVALIVTNSIWQFNQNWILVLIIISVGYFFIRYKITGPLQMFATRFNMMVDYDLDVEGALKMVEDNFENAPTQSIKSMFMIYLGMALYYNARYRESVNTFNQINLAKVNHLYHVLIFAFTAYSAYEEGDDEAFNIALDRLDQVKNRVSKKYLSFATGYIEILNAMKNMKEDPETYREVIERNFSREDGYISTKLVYNYRMALYYRTVDNVEEMDKCFAKCIANGKGHHTAIQAKKQFQGTCNVEDFVFSEPSTEPEEVDIVEEPKQIGDIEEVERIEEIETIGEPTEDDITRE